ncbi:MAG: type IV secretion system DNA-binding domain-containing protein [Afipia sp.]|nr:type IV secretion system DNA-binding domain-containing protein [Afipia sp.]
MDRLAKYEYRPAAPAAFSALGMGLMACFLGIVISFMLITPTAWRADAAVAVTATELLSAIENRGLAEAISADDLFRETAPRLISIALAAILSGILAFRIKRRIQPIVDGRQHHEGLQLLRGAAAIASANRALAAQARPLDRTIQWLPSVPIPRAREVQNLLILGAIGSGKTRLILYLLEQLVRRLLQNPAEDYGLFVHDTTGEILEGFPMEDGQFAVINPDRPGCFAWAMGRDFRDDSDCESAAEQIIGQTSDAFWGKGATTLFAGCMILCKAKHGSDWGLPRLYMACLSDPVQMKKDFEQYYRPAAGLIEFDASGELSKTTISLLLTFRGSVLRVLRPLARAWAKVPPERQFSFGDWVNGANPQQPKVVIVQRSGRHPEMSAAWIGMAVDFITAAVGDIRLSVSQTRIRTFVLDEAPALGRLRRWPDLLDTARNKGVSTIAAIQDVAQFKRIYGDAAASIFQRFLTKIICAQTQGPETTALADDMIGKRWIMEDEPTVAVERGPTGRTERSSITKRPREVPIVRPEHLAYRLGVANRKIKALVVGLGDVLEVEWPMRIWGLRRRV